MNVNKQVCAIYAALQANLRAGLYLSLFVKYTKLIILKH